VDGGKGADRRAPRKFGVNRAEVLADGDELNRVLPPIEQTIASQFAAPRAVVAAGCLSAPL
jgi:hypothetical protein